MKHNLKHNKISQIIKYFSSQYLDKIVSPQLIYMQIEKRLRHFSKNEIILAIDNYFHSEWWQNNCSHYPPEWVFKKDNIKKLLNIKRLKNNESCIKEYGERFIRCYNWCIKLYFQQHSEYHQFINNDNTQIKFVADFLKENSSVLKQKCFDALGIKLNIMEIIFLYIVDSFTRLPNPPPLYYYYSEGLLNDFSYDRILEAHTYWQDWQICFGLDLQEDAESIKIKKPKPFNRVVDSAFSKRIAKKFRFG